MKLLGLKYSSAYQFHPIIFRFNKSHIFLVINILESYIRFKIILYILNISMRRER